MTMLCKVPELTKRIWWSVVKFVKIELIFDKILIKEMTNLRILFHLIKKNLMK